MITNGDFLLHMRSVWNSRKIRKNIFDSNRDKRFLLVEGLLDGVLVSSLGKASPFTPIAVSYLAYSKQNEDYVVTETTHEGRGKEFVIHRIKQNHPNEFALIDMDHDYEQNALRDISDRAIDTSESMTLIGKIVTELMSFIEAFIERLCKNELLTNGQASELLGERMYAYLQVKVLSMQRFLRHTRSTFDDNWKCQVSGKELHSLYKELKQGCPKNVDYINDHDLENVMISFLQPTLNEHVVKRELNSFILKVTKESEHQIRIDDNQIKWI